MRRVRQYGDGDVANRPEYNFRRTVDYASAACLLVRRSAFIAVGGFDPRFRARLLRGRRPLPGARRRTAGAWSISRGRWSSTCAAPRAPAACRAARSNATGACSGLDGDRSSIGGHPRAGGSSRARSIGGRDAMTCERILVLTGPRPDAAGTPEQRRLHTLVVAAARRWPRARWTVASLDGEPVTRPDDLSDAGIEAVTGAPSWEDMARRAPLPLRGRRDGRFALELRARWTRRSAPPSPRRCVFRWPPRSISERWRAHLVAPIRAFGRRCVRVSIPRRQTRRHS